MACGSRPVERIPELGAFPTAGIHPAAGLLRTAASVLNPPPPNRRWAKHSCRQRAERPKQNPLPKTSGHPSCSRLRCANRADKSEFPARGKRWASLNAQRQPTRAVRRLPRLTKLPKRALHAHRELRWLLHFHAAGTYGRNGALPFRSTIIERHPRGKRWASLNAQRQPTRD